MTAKVQDSHSQPPRGIAIVGMGGCFPDAANIAAFWQNICRNHVAIRQIPANRWPLALYYSPDKSLPEHTYSRVGGFIDKFEFNAKRFRIPPRTLGAIDTLQQMALSAVYEALSDAKLEVFAGGGGEGRPFNRDRTAVIMGNAMGGEAEDLTSIRVWFTGARHALETSVSFLALTPAEQKALLEEFERTYKATLPTITEDSMPGELSNCITGRICNAFDLRGPNFTTDAACAASLAAMHTAVAGLHAGTFDVALVGGADRSMDPPTYVKFSKIGALAADLSAPFDSRASGFVMGEGVGVLVLKRLADAQADGDKIYAVIRGIGAASDGRGKGMTAPNPKGQRLALDRAYADAACPVSSVGLFEAHGTSTIVGDATEVQVLTDMLKESGNPPRRVPLGSVKSMIGHLKSAAGAASMIKTVLALHHKILPPSANFKSPPEGSLLNEGFLEVITGARPWVATQQPRRAGVSAFGFGGTNFHVVLEEAPQLGEGNLQKTPTIATHTTPATASAGMAAASGSEAIAAHIIGIFAEKTGYDVADLAIDHELESDLGIDTVKQAEIMAVVQKHYGLTSAVRLSELRTLRHIVDAIAASGAGQSAPTQGAEGPAVPRAAEVSSTQGPQVLVFGGNDAASVMSGAEACLSGADQWTAHMLSGRAQALQAPHRLAFWAESVNEARKKLADVTKLRPKLLAAQGIFLSEGAPLAKDAKVAFLFPGQGSQYLGMMRDLAEQYPVVAQTFAEADSVLLPLTGRKLTDVVWPAVADEKADLTLRDTENCQPAMLTADVAMLRLLATYGAKPDMVAGHSLGEYAAAVAAGVLNFADALYAVSARGREMAGVQVPDNGKMAMVAADAARVQAIVDQVQGYVVCANKNCHTQTVIAGGSAAIDDAIARCAAAGLEARQIPVSHAFHCEIVAPAAGPLQKVLENLDIRAPKIPILSNVDASFYPDDKAEIVRYLGRQLASPVEFIGQIEAMYAHGARIFVEVGPRRAVTGFVRNILGTKEHRALASNHHKRPGQAGVFELLAALASNGVALDFGAGAAPGVSVPPAQPTSLTPITRAAMQDAVVISGVAVALPTPNPVGTLRDDLFAPMLAGQNFIEPIEDSLRHAILDHNVVRLNKAAGSFEPLRELKDVLSLVARFGELNLVGDYGVDEAMVDALDQTAKLSIAVGLDALRDAGLPLVERFRITSNGARLHDRWALPQPLAARTGVILAAAFPGVDRILSAAAQHAAAQASRKGAKAVRAFGESWAQSIGDPRERARFTEAFEKSEQTLLDADSSYVFNRKWLFRALSLGHAQLAQLVLAQGPNTQINAACASGTQAIGLARDWIRLGHCDRVVVVTADDVTNDACLPWFGAAFLAAGAATVEPDVEKAAVPFGADRNGMILGAGAAGFVVELQEQVTARGMVPIAEIIAHRAANSAFHGTRLDGAFISQVMEEVAQESCAALTCDMATLARRTMFMSHETYTPARGGSSAAEVQGLRHTFGVDIKEVLVANTKGYTGHPMAATLEDAVAIKALQRQTVPAIANLGSIDPAFADLRLSSGGSMTCDVAMRFAAGFGSQVALAVYRRCATEEARLQDGAVYMQWLAKVTDGRVTGLAMQGRVLRGVVTQGVAPWQLGIPSLHLTDGQTPRAHQAAEPAAAAVTAPARAEPAAAAVIAPARAEPAAAAVAAPVSFVPGVQPVATAPTGPAAATAAQPVATAPTGPAAGPAAAMLQELIALFAEQTGYDVADLDPDHHLEADLGIDTVKQAELLAMVRKRYALTDAPVFKLSEVQTLRLLAQAMASAPAPAVQSAAMAAAVQPTAPVATARTAAVLVADLDVLAELRQMFADQTGYALEDLAPEHALEADLGIDTVKQAEIIALVRQRYGLPQDENFRLSELPTLKDLADYVQARLPAPPSIDVDAQSAQVLAALPAPALPGVVAAGAPSGHGRDAIAAYVLQAFAEHTGYDRADLTTDQSLEADLGIDTVKQAEIMGQLRKHYALATDTPMVLSSLQSIDAIVDFITTHAKAVEPEVAAVHSATTAPAAAAPMEEPTTPRVSQATAPPPVVPAAQDPSSAGPLTKEAVLPTLLALFAEQTGYQIADLDPSHALEADLGIDTVKQAEVFALVRKHFDLPAEQTVKLAQVSTIDALADYVVHGHTQSAQPQPFSARAVTLVVAPNSKPMRTLHGKSIALLGGAPAARVLMHAALMAKGARVNMLDATLESVTGPNARVPWPVDGVVLLCDATARDPDAVHARTKLGFALMHAFARATPADADTLGVLMVGGDGRGFGTRGQHPHAWVLCAWAAMCKSLVRERPACRALTVDWAEAVPDAALCTGTLDAWLRDGPAELTRHQNAWHTLTRAAPISVPASSPLAAHAVVVATGGARGVTYALVHALAQQGPLRLVILGRTAGVPKAQSPLTNRSPEEQKQLAQAALAAAGQRVTPAAVKRWCDRQQARVDIGRNMQALTDLGCTVTFIACDVSDAAAVDAAVAQIQDTCERCDVLIHGAGVEESRFLADKDLEAFERSFAPKATAALRLRDKLRPRRMVTLGSVAGRFGNAGQVDYAAANEVLAACARSPGGQNLNLAWTAWGDIGMATRGSTRKVLEQNGVAVIPRDVGVALGASLITSSVTGDFVVAGALGTWEENEIPAPAQGSVVGLLTRVDVPAIPGVAATAERTYRRRFDPKQDLGLDHHRIDGIAVIPGVLGIEIMAQAASDALGRRVRSLYDIRFAAPIKLFRDAPLDVFVHVSPKSWGAEVRVESAFVGPGGRTAHRTHFFARVKTADLHDAWPSRPGALEMACDPKFTQEEIYQRYFHGPRFHVLHQVVGLGDNGADGRAPDAMPSWLRHVTASEYITSPWLREAGFQIAGLWEMSQFGRMALPSAIDELHLSDNLPDAPFGRYTLHARRRRSEAQGCVFDVCICDAAGNPVDVMRGYRTVSYRDLTPEERFDPAAPARSTTLDMPRSVSVALDEVSTMFASDLESALQHYLAPSEIVRFRELKIHKRQLDWLAVRIAAKRLIRERCFGTEGAIVPYNAITLHRDELGAPVVEIVGDTQPAPHISMSHSAGVAAAYLSPLPNERCGIDVESVQERDPAFAQTYFTPQEQQRVAASPNPALALTEIWAVKEAVLKALGIGARVDFRETQTTHDATGWHVTLVGETLARARHLGAGPCRVDVEPSATRVIAKVLMPVKPTVMSQPHLPQARV